MTYTKSFAYGTNGNLALKPEVRPQLVLLQGGSSHVALERNHTKTTDPSFGLVSVVIVAALVCFMLIDSAFGSLRSQKLQNLLEQVSYEKVVVSSGDSYWSLAEAHPVEGVSTADLADWLASYNRVDSSSLVAGSSVLVPTALD